MPKPLSLFYLLSFSLLVAILTSCGSIKNYKYFQDIPDSVSTTLNTASYIEPKIQSDDILYIAIQTVDPSAGNTINTLNAQGTTSSPLSSSSNPSTGGIITNQGVTYGYLVDRRGYVTIPVLGDVMVGNLTTQQARVLISQNANRYYKDPSVIVRFANFKVTVLGEVQRPGSYTVLNEKVSILDAIGYAGDLTIYGKRDNILLLRQREDGKTIAVRFNLNKASAMQSPYFYLQQNDQIYVEPNKAKISNSDGTQIRNISIASALLSFIVVLVSRF
ncbi:polysaccharide biosynthesis/export family protein [Pedobacter sp. MC2016-24]|uniref:polysaccharide biosynthesis/export family protein n=1 Tax=Pedobacter sp. MC2016-24 TaxID=2780090 RepID=UPI0018815343|nr:polysaccharide biosynthesis/export family protein [Pedobacter sp. MC2016-24]MBE9599516.1 polysaccharide biosynthesis/export family protein [Pedobacter sp. MC2016-24]